MDVLKQKLNDIGSCIGYPFYFFEDGSFSNTFVCGKMNACLVVKSAFAKSDKCFFASAEVALMSRIKAMEKSWAQKSDASDKVNWFKKYLNDIGTVLNYPFYVFDDGAYAKTSSLKGKQAVLYVKKPFTSVEGECTFFSADSRKVLQFEKDWKKLNIQKTEFQQIIFRMLACQRVYDGEMLQVIEAERFDLFPNYAKIYHFEDSKEMYTRYPKLFLALAKANRCDILEMFGCLSLSGLSRDAIRDLYLVASLPTLEYFWNKLTKKSICFGEVFFNPEPLIERGDVEIYRIYREHCHRIFSNFSYYHFEVSEILKFKATNMLVVLLQDCYLTLQDQGKLVASGNLELIQTYIRMCGMSQHFRQLLLYSGNDELVKLVNQPEPSTQHASQEEKVAKKSGVLFQRIRKFFDIRA